MNKAKSTFCAGLLLCAAVVFSGHVAAGVIYQSGFEDPPFVAGQLAGQAGWVGDSIPTVQSAVVNGGNQAVAAAAIGITGQHIAGLSVSYDSVGNPAQIVRIGIDFLTDGVGGGQYDNGVFWQLPAAFGTNGFLGQVGMNDDGRIRLGLASSAILGPLVSLGEWHRVELVLDFGARTLAGALDGAEFASAPMFNTSTDVTFVYFLGINGSRQSSSSTAYFDDASIVSVPEPGTLALIGLSLAGLAATRTRRQ